MKKKKSFILKHKVAITACALIACFCTGYWASGATLVGEDVTVGNDLTVTGTSTFTGNVGIGTTSPGANLEINDSSNTVYNLSIINGGGSATGILVKGGNTGSDARLLNIISNTDVPFFTVTDGNSYFQNGNVGIGTTSPSSHSQLHIYTSTDVFQPITIEAPRPTLFLKETDTTDTNFQIRVDGGSLVFQQQTDAGTSASTKMTILTAGNVGIGTTSPSQKLHVVGNIYKTGTVSFVEDYPNDPSKRIVYISLEGPEAGTYIRGTADCEDNEVVIIFPEHFRLVTSENGATAQLTPRLQSMDLFIKELTNEKLIVGCGIDGTFDYFVNGIRHGYENHQVIQEK